MEETDTIKGPERVWVLVKSDRAVANAEKIHATSVPDRTDLDGVWREYIRIDHADAFGHLVFDRRGGSFGGPLLTRADAETQARRLDESFPNDAPHVIRSVNVGPGDHAAPEVSGALGFADVDWPLVIAALDFAAESARKGGDANPIAALIHERIHFARAAIEDATAAEVSS